MTDKEILANAPEGVTHVLIDIEYHPTYVKFDMEGRRYFWHYPSLNHWYEMVKMPDNDIHSLADIRALVEKDDRIKEIEKELDAQERQAHRFAVFICKTIARLDGIPEFEPTKQMLSRLVSGNELQAHNLEQQAKGIDDSINNSDVCWADNIGDCVIKTDTLAQRKFDLLEQAKQLLEGVE